MSELIASVRTATGVTNILLSAISVIELEYGLWRATTPEITQKRRLYVDEVLAIGTSNVRHFRMIPNLEVKQL
jgi:hypothetical protein